MNFGLYPVAARNLPFQDWEREYLESTRDYVFRNTFAGITYLAGLMRDAGTRPEIEIYDLGQLYNLRQLVNDGVVEPLFSLQFVLGVLGGASSEPDHLIYLLRTAERLFGAGSFTWSAAGVMMRIQPPIKSLGVSGAAFSAKALTPPQCAWPSTTMCLTFNAMTANSIAAETPCALLSGW